MFFDCEGVNGALADHGPFSSDLSPARGNGNRGGCFIFFDPPRHTKLRALISKAFTPRVVANLEPRIRELSRQLLDRTIERGEMDLAADRSEEHTSELQSQSNLVCRLLLENKNICCA